MRFSKSARQRNPSSLLPAMNETDWISTEPTPAEEAAARAKETEEQAALPYKWTQTIGELDLTIEVPGNLKGRDFVVDIKKKKLSVAIKGQDPIISVRIFYLLCYSNFWKFRATFLTRYMLMSPPGH